MANEVHGPLGNFDIRSRPQPIPPSRRDGASLTLIDPDLSSFALRSLEPFRHRRLGRTPRLDALEYVDATFEFLLRDRRRRGFASSSIQSVISRLLVAGFRSSSGSSPTVERAIDASGRRADIERRRALRRHFLSRADVLRILGDPTFAGPTLQNYRGDCQVHLEWSDGNATLAAISRACQGRGHAYAAVTDHSYGLKIAGGMSMQEAVDQLELVLAAPPFKTSESRRPNASNARGDPTPDRSDSRASARPDYWLTGRVIAQWPVVFAAAAERGVAIEIDGDPARQDLDYTLAAAALGAGCLFALDSDAHTVGQLAYAEPAIAHARLAGIPPDRIANCWPLDRLLA